MGCSVRTLASTVMKKAYHVLFPQSRKQQKSQVVQFTTILKTFFEQKHGIILPAKSLKKHFFLHPEVCVGRLIFDIKPKQH